MLSLKFVGKTNDPMSEIIKEVQADTKEIQDQINSLGDQSLVIMKETIQSSKKRPQAGQPTALENAIEIEKFSDGWGIGDIEKLRKDAPWWAAFNFGSSHMVGKHLPKGVFDPGEPSPNDSFFRQGRWSKGSNYNGEQYSPIVKKPIPATNFIEKTIFWVSSKFDSLGGK